MNQLDDTKSYLNFFPCLIMNLPLVFIQRQNYPVLTKHIINNFHNKFLKSLCVSCAETADERADGPAPKSTSLRKSRL
jgi:hypothetical protein